jgi:arginine decarboxylase
MHVPGHKQGRGSDATAAALIPQHLYDMDLTEIPGLDDLQRPSGCIAATEEKAARLFGADRSFLLVNGSTVGVEAAIMAICRPGSRLAISAAVHRSVIAGLALSGAEPVFLDTPVSHRYLVPLGVSAATVDRCLAAETGISAVLVTNPSYYGVCQDLEAIARVCHEREAVLIVDEAHGSHLSFSDSLPASGLEAGADVVIQSTHKTLGAMTQAAMLHVKGDRVDCERIASCLRMLQTSSPSYVLMASLDSAIYRFSLEGERLVASAAQNANEVRESLGSIAGVGVLSAEDIGPESAVDPTRLTITAVDRGVLGSELQERLRTRGFQVEFSDLLNSIAVITYSDAAADLQRFCSAVADAVAESPIDFTIAEGLCERIRPVIAGPAGEERKFAMSVRDAVFSARRSVNLDESVGETSADSVCPYPPGIPLLLPGQRITRPIVDLVKTLVAAGLMFHGMSVDGHGYSLAIVDGDS